MSDDRKSFVFKGNLGALYTGILLGRGSTCTLVVWIGMSADKICLTWKIT